MVLDLFPFRWCQIQEVMRSKYDQQHKMQAGAIVSTA